MKKIVKFAGGGKKQKQPVNTPDSLFSTDIVEFLLAVSEGPIRGLTNGAKSFYVGDTQLVSNVGETNFGSFAIGVHPGYPAGSARPIQLRMGGTASNTEVGIALLQNTAVTRTTSATLRDTIDRLEVRLYFARLFVSNNNGTFNGTARFKVEYKRSSSSTWISFYPEAEIELTGKTTGGAVREFRVDVPRISEDWDIRVTKLSSDTDTTNIVEMSWESYQAVTLESPVYPNTAVIHGIGEADGQFSSIPEFSSVVDGLICRIPTNYNPDTATYDETTPWDGTFKWGWTNNNAWILYEMIVNTDFGYAHHYPFIDANRYDFYKAAKWCDERTPAGNRRFTFNDVIREQRPAMEQLNYVAASFNALVWDDLSGKIHLRVDEWEEPSLLFVPENVIDGMMNYTFTDPATRVNDVSVTFINPDLDWNEDRRRIPGVTTDQSAIDKYGRIPDDFIAVGCTDPTEAVQRARYRLLAAQNEKMMVSFATTRLGSILSLFENVWVGDPDLGQCYTGRIKSFTSNRIYLRDPLYYDMSGYYYIRIQAYGTTIVRRVQVPNVGDNTELILESPLPAGLPPKPCFILSRLLNTGVGDGLGKPYRVMGADETDGNPYEFTVQCLEVYRDKYTVGGNIEPVQTIPPDYNKPLIPDPPYNAKAQSLNQGLLADSGEVIPRILVTWETTSPSVVTGYEVRWRLQNDADWVVLPVADRQTYLQPVAIGETYEIEVRALGAQANSNWSEIDPHTVVAPNTTPSLPLQFSTTPEYFAIRINWKYDNKPFYKQAELRVSSTTSDFSAAVPLTIQPYPIETFTHGGLTIGTFNYYWIRFVDKLGNATDWSGPLPGQPQANVDGILELLDGHISEQQLTTDLATKIDKIEGFDDGLTDLDETIQSVQQGLVYEIENREGLAAQMRGDYPGTDITQLTQGLLYSERVARATQDSALASSISTVSTTVAGHTTSIQTQQTSINGLSAQYTVKIDNNGYVTGYGLASEPVNGTPYSTFTIRADAFYVGAPGLTTKWPFKVLTTPTVIGGATIPAGVYMADAFIHAAYVDTLKIAGNAVTVPVFAKSTWTASGLQTRQTSTLTTTTANYGGANVVIDYTVDVQLGVYWGTQLIIAISRNGVEILRTVKTANKYVSVDGQTALVEPILLSDKFIDTPGDQNVYYTITLWSDSYNSRWISERLVLLCLGVKR